MSRTAGVQHVTDHMAQAYMDRKFILTLTGWGSDQFYLGSLCKLDSSMQVICWVVNHGWQVSGEMRVPTATPQLNGNTHTENMLYGKYIGQVYIDYTISRQVLCAISPTGSTSRNSMTIVLISCYCRKIFWLRECCRPHSREALLSHISATSHHYAVNS